MGQYIDKSALVAEIEKNKNEMEPERDWHFDEYTNGYLDALKEALSIINTLEVKEVEDYIIPKHSYFEHIYHCGSEPMWKIGDVLAAYQFYSDYEGEYMYGKITDIKMDENEDWLYTFENGEELYENMLISDEAYKKN